MAIASNANPTSLLDLVIFGGVGDLSVRKLLPALYMAHLLSLIEIMEPPVVEIMEPLFDRFFTPSGTAIIACFLPTRNVCFFNVSGLSVAIALQGQSVSVV